MISEINNGIEVKVQSEYVEEYSDPRKAFHYFAYHITIINHNPFTVKLLSRHWIITDCADRIKEVIGEGVVGKHPVLHPGEQFEYSSACDFKAGIGTMKGHYFFKKLSTGDRFNAKIPEFINEAKYILN